MEDFNYYFDFDDVFRDENQNQVLPFPGPHVGKPLESKESKLLDLTSSSKYTLIQRNGQRIYGGPPPGWTGPTPEKGCEVFVGKVPRDCYEDELVPLFEKAGRIYELRLMMDFSGSNRGYLFVRYTSREEAKQAVEILNNYEIRPGKRIGVVLSVDNRKLWISGIPKNHSADEIKNAINEITEGVINVILYPSQTDKSKPRSYAFVEYESHRAAALARRKLVPGGNYLFGHEIEKVDWAEPENEVDEEVMSKVKVLFVRNLMPSTTELDIREVFEKLGNTQVERVKKTRDYAFVHFPTREAAERALEKAKKGLTLDGSDLEVKWSKPVDKVAYNTRKNLTRLLSNGTPSVLSGYQGYESPLFQLNQGYPVPPVMEIRGIFPRKRGAAGIKGLGAPGTAPPRRLMKMTGLCNGGMQNHANNHSLFNMAQPGAGLNGNAAPAIAPQTPTEVANGFGFVPFSTPGSYSIRGMMPPQMNGFTGGMVSGEQVATSTFAMEQLMGNLSLSGQNNARF